MSMISAAASTNSPKNGRDPAGISLLPDFMFLSHAEITREDRSRWHLRRADLGELDTP